mgnify:CR=1 FL=1
MADSYDETGSSIPEEDHVEFCIRSVACRECKEKIRKANMDKYILDGQYGKYLEMIGVKVGEALKEAGVPEDLFSWESANGRFKGN